MGVAERAGCGDTNTSVWRLEESYQWFRWGTTSECAKGHCGSSDHRFVWGVEVTHQKVYWSAGTEQRHSPKPGCAGTPTCVAQSEFYCSRHPVGSFDCSDDTQAMTAAVRIQRRNEPIWASVATNERQNFGHGLLDGGRLDR